MGIILTFSDRAEQGIDELKQALALDPNLAFAHAQIGFAKIVLGRAEETEADVLEAMRLSPRDTGAYVWCSFVGDAKLVLGDDKEAVVLVRRSIEANRNYPIARFHCAAALALSGQVEGRPRRKPGRTGARAGFHHQNATGKAPSATTQIFAQRQRILEGLKLAGVPEE